jgi:hypothetical protein
MGRVPVGAVLAAVATAVVGCGASDDGLRAAASLVPDTASSTPTLLPVSRHSKTLVCPVREGRRMTVRLVRQPVAR